MEPHFKFRSGKYAGRTYEWVEDNDPSYLAWIVENRPEMLRDHKKKEVKKEVKVIDVKEEPCEPTLKPNENFYNDPPDASSIPYMLDNAEDYQEQLLAFSVAHKREFRLIKEEYERKKISRV
jgi:hypothetical protein